MQTHGFALCHDAAMPDPRVQQLATIPELEYLVLAKGQPWTSGFRHRSCRVDALARTARAALTSGRAIHFLFQDCTLLHFEPTLLSSRQPWGQHVRGASEGELLAVFEQLLKCVSLPGATVHQPQPLRTCIDSVIRGTAVWRPVSRFGLVLNLRQGGCPLLFGGKGGCQPECFPKILVTLGGVRDASDVEEAEISLACSRSQIDCRRVSLGYIAELTSKMVKVLEASVRLGLFPGALRAMDWAAQPIARTGHWRRPPLHIVALLAEPFAAAGYIAANLITDVFLRSHGRTRGVSLTLVDSKGSAIELHADDVHGFPVLREADAISFIHSRQAWADIEPPGLPHVIRRALRSMQSRARCVVALHADADFSPLAVAEPRAADGGEQAVLSILAPASKYAVVKDACASAAVFSKACVGGETVAAAFLGFVHAEGLLGPSIYEVGMSSAHKTERHEQHDEERKTEHHEQHGGAHHKRDGWRRSRSRSPLPCGQARWDDGGHGDGARDDYRAACNDYRVSRGNRRWPSPQEWDVEHSSGNSHRAGASDGEGAWLYAPNPCIKLRCRYTMHDIGAARFKDLQNVATHRGGKIRLRDRHGFNLLVIVAEWPDDLQVIFDVFLAGVASAGLSPSSLVDPTLVTASDSIDEKDFLLLARVPGTTGSGDLEGDASIANADVVFEAGGEDDDGDFVPVW